MNMNNPTPLDVEIARTKMGDAILVLTLTNYRSAPHVPAIAATLIDEGGFAQPYGKLTVNLSGDGVVLAPWSATIKTWAENESLAKACLDTGIFESTVLVWQTGFVNAPVWRLRSDRLTPEVAAEVASLMNWPASSQRPREKAAPRDSESANNEPFTPVAGSDFSSRSPSAGHDHQRQRG